MRSTTKAVLEVSLLFALVIGICKILYLYRSIPFVSQALPLLAATLFLYVPLLLLFMSRRPPEIWGITLQKPIFSVMIALAVSAVCLPSFVFLLHIYRHVWLQVSAPMSLSSDWPVVLLYHLLCVAFPEEVFYRGYMQSRLNEVFLKRVNVFHAHLGFGWIYTAALFAIGHFMIAYRVDTLTTFFPGLVFGWLRERTGSVVAPTIFHALCNTTVLMLS